MTGSYHNSFHLYDINGKNDVTLEASKNGTTCFFSPTFSTLPFFFWHTAFKKKSATTKSKLGIGRKKKDDVNVENIDFSKKILHAAWHPHENSIAVAATNNLFIFSQL